jgi:hypothetical protein
MATLPQISSSTEVEDYIIMEWLYYVSYLFGGAFLTNALPHLISGLMGRPFQSPFAKPPGQGLSSSTVNVLWGFLNLVIAYILLCRVGNFNLRATDQIIAAGLGALLFGVVLARQFGRFHGGNDPEGSLSVKENNGIDNR